MEKICKNGDWVWGMGAVGCGANGGWCAVPCRLRFAPVPTLLRRSALAAWGRHLPGTAARGQPVFNGADGCVQLPTSPKCPRAELPPAQPGG